MILLYRITTFITENVTIRISNKNQSTKKDDCLIISSNIVCIVKNISSINDKIFLVCSKFNDLVSLYDQPYSSISVGSTECKSISSDLQMYHIIDVKYKACYFLHLRIFQKNLLFLSVLCFIYSVNYVIFK